MSVYRVIYASRPFGFDSGLLNGILLDARRLNARDAITGALICRDDIYLQLLEGPKDKVAATLERIKRDDRHLDLRLFLEGDVPERMFGEWAMLHDPAVTWIWPRAAVAKGAAENATPLEVEDVFRKLRDKHDAVAPG